MQTKWLPFPVFVWFAAMACLPLPAPCADGASVSSFEAEFKALTAGLDGQNKDTPNREWHILLSLLDKADESTRQKEIARLKAMALTNSPEEDFADFDEKLVEAFAERLLITNDMSRLIRFLAGCCPDSIGAAPLEYVLAGRKGTDAVLILGRVHAEAGTNRAAKTVIESLSRAFPILRTQFPKDVDFLAACERWAKEHRANFKLNYDYPYLPNSHLIGDEEEERKAKAVGLFLEKEDKRKK